MRTSNSLIISEALEKGLTVKFKDTDGVDMWLDNEGLRWFNPLTGYPMLHTMTDIYGLEDVVGELEWEIL